MTGPPDRQIAVDNHVSADDVASGVAEQRRHAPDVP
jgi:hypothetical protein